MPKPGRSEVDKQDTGPKPFQPHSGQPLTGANPQAQADQLKTTVPDSHGDQYSSEQQGGADWPMYVLTFLLVVVGFLQALIFRRQTHIIDNSLTDSRESTRLAHQTLVLSQRPRLAIRNLVIEEPSGGSRFIALKADEPTFQPDRKVEGTLVVVNAGNGQATVCDSFCRVFNSGRPDELPMQPPYDPKAGAACLPGQRVLKPGEAASIRFSGKGPSLDQIQHAGSPNSDKLHLYFLGWIDYSDELGIVRRVAFCRRYHRGFDKFVRVVDPDYEYSD